MNNTRVTRRGSRGFTLVEVLATLLFMAIVIPVAMQGILLANRTGAAAERKRVAAQLGDQLLTELVIGEAWLDAETEGDFGEDWPGYRWVLEDNAWDEDAMRELCVTVLFDVQGRETSVRLCTLVPDEEAISEEEAGTEP